MLAALVLSALLSPAISPELTVYVFTTTDCPIANRYAPEIQRLAQKFDRTARFVLVYPIPTDSPELIREHKKKFAYTIDSVRDTDQRLVRMTGVTISPEVAIMKGGQLLYRGRVDDRYLDLGTDRQVATTHDLESALDAITTGKQPAHRETQAIGCFLADLAK